MKGDKREMKIRQFRRSISRRENSHNEGKRKEKDESRLPGNQEADAQWSGGVYMSQKRVVADTKTVSGGESSV